LLPSKALLFLFFFSLQVWMVLIMVRFAVAVLLDAYREVWAWQ